MSRSPRLFRVPHARRQLGASGNWVLGSSCGCRLGNASLGKGGHQRSVGWCSVAVLHRRAGGASPGLPEHGSQTRTAEVGLHL